MKKTVALIALFVMFLAFSPLLFPYNPPLEAIDSYETYHVTNTTYFGNLTKNFQDLIEQEPCTYEILGWDQDNNLYYQSVCVWVSATYKYSPTVQTKNLTPQKSGQTVAKKMGYGRPKPRKPKDPVFLSFTFCDPRALVGTHFTNLPKVLHNS